MALTGSAIGSLSSGAPGGIEASDFPPKVTGTGVPLSFPSASASATVIAPTFRPRSLSSLVSRRRTASPPRLSLTTWRTVASVKARTSFGRATAAGGSGALNHAADQVESGAAATAGFGFGAARLGPVVRTTAMTAKVRTAGERFMVSLPDSWGRPVAADRRRTPVERDARSAASGSPAASQPAPRRDAPPPR